MKTIRPLLLLLTLLCLLPGCEKELKVDLDFHEDPMLNVYGFVYTDRPTMLMISRTKPYNTPQNISTRVEEATIRYYINGILEETSKVTDQTKAEYRQNIRSDEQKLLVFPRTKMHRSTHLWYISRLKPHAGDRIRIEIDSPGLPPASFEAVLPPIPALFDLQARDLSVSTNNDISGIRKLKTDYEEVRAKRNKIEGWSDETSPLPSFDDLAESQKVRAVSFKVKGINREQFYALGAIPTLKLPYIPETLGLPLSSEESNKNDISILLFDLCRLLNNEGTPIFLVTAKDIARQRVKNSDQSTIFQTYFFTGADSGEYRVEVLVPIIKADPSDYGVGQSSLMLTALSSEYGQFAESGYDLLERPDSDLDLDVSDLTAEHAMERSNLKGALGTIYTAASLEIPLP